MAILDGTRIVSTFTNFSGLADNAVSCLARAPDGAVWFGTKSGCLARINAGDGVPSLATNISSDRILAIYAGLPNSVWIATESVILRFDGTNWTTFTEKEGGLPNVISITAGPDGAVWFASRDGVAKFNGKVMTPVSDDRDLLIPMHRENNGTL